MSTKTIIDYIGHGERSQDIERLFEMLAEHPLDRSFRSGGDYLEPPVWCGPTPWARDGSDGEQHAFGNFATYSCAFNLTTNDPALIERLRAAIDTNMQRPDYLAQSEPPMSLPLLRSYLGKLGLAGPEWDHEPVSPTCIILAPCRDDQRIICRLRVDNAEVCNYGVDRRELGRQLIVHARTRRLAPDFTRTMILGPLDGSEPGTLVHALVNLAAKGLADLNPKTCPRCGRPAHFGYATAEDAIAARPICWGESEADCPGWPPGGVLATQ